MQSNQSKEILSDTDETQPRDGLDSKTRECGDNETGAAASTYTLTAAGKRGRSRGRGRGRTARNEFDAALSPPVTSAIDATFHPTASRFGRLASGYLRVFRRCSPGNPPLVSIATVGEWKMARGTPAPRQPVRPTEVEPHAGAVGRTGENW